MNIIMRPIYNRPEMLKLSLEYELAAREFYAFSSKFKTLFIVEHGTPQEVINIMKTYPFEYEAVYRDKKHGLTPNILEGFKKAFSNTEDYVIYIEDDVLVHKTYFKYLDTILGASDTGPFSVISPYNFNDDGDVHEIKRYHHYAALAPLINKKFHTDYILKISNKNYYNNRPALIYGLDKEYASYTESKQYKYITQMHNEQAGVINRLVDIAMIEEKMYVIMPSVNRQQHIGYFGKNRPGGVIPGDTFEDRLSNLRIIIEDAERMYDLSATKQYNDYSVFSEKLNEWDGTLRYTNEAKDTIPYR